MIRITAILLVLAVALAMCMSDFGPARAQSTVGPPTQSVPLAKEGLSLEQLLSTINERDRGYREKFEAQDKAVAAALAAAEKAVEAALAAQKEAVNKADLATEKRFESVNEFRAQLKDQAAMLAPRSEMDVRFNAIAASINDLRSTVVSANESLRNRLTTIEARGEGQQSLWALIAGFIATAAVIVTVILSLFRKPAPRAH